MKRIRKLALTPIILLLTTSIIGAESHTSANYTLSGGRIVSGGGEAESATCSLSGVAVGGFAGGKGESAIYTLRAGFIIGVTGGLSIEVGALEPIGWQAGDPVQAGGTLLARAPIKNTGGVKVSLSLAAQDTTIAVEKWQAGTIPGENNVNTYVMSAIITGEEIAGVDESYFNENGDEDIVSELVKPADANTFASSQSGQNGINIMPNETRYLYLKFDVPRADTTGTVRHEEHTIYIEVRAN